MAESLDKAVSDELFEMGGAGRDEVRAANMHSENRHVQNVRLKRAADFFDFGKFRHRNNYRLERERRRRGCVTFRRSRRRAVWWRRESGPAGTCGPFALWGFDR